MTDVEKYLKDNDLLLFGWNPFFKGILSDEDRKMPIQKYCENFKFFCKHTDLLGAPIEITPLFSTPFMEKNWKDALLHDLMEFMFDWYRNVYVHLNGYSGIHGITYEFDERIKKFDIEVEKLPDNIWGM